MRDSLTPGKKLPESYEDFLSLVAAGQHCCLRCINCKRPFTADSAYSSLGWAETQISGVCEPCFDKLFADEDEDDSSPPTTPSIRRPE
jgi:hypothetical protein